MKTLTEKKTRTSGGNGKATKKDDSIIKSAAAIAKNLKEADKAKAKNGNGKANADINDSVKISDTVKTQLSLDQKIEKIENLKTLIDKRDKLEISRKKLGSFVVGTNQFNENIVLTDESGNTFKTSNSEVFTKVVDAINETLIAKIREIENQIEF